MDKSAFDTETTGLLRPFGTDLNLQPYITEIYLCKFDEDFRVTSEFETFVKPKIPISDEITKITGISDYTVRDAPSFIDIFDELAEFMLGVPDIFAHNCSFDMGVLICELQRYDLEHKFPWPPRQHCTVELSYPIRNHRIKLGDLYNIATGKTLLNAHRAKTDTMALVDCVKWLYAQGFIR